MRIFRISINRCGKRVCGPTFKKSFACRGAQFRSEGDAGNISANFSPGGWAKLAKGIVLRGDALKVKQEMTFAFARACVARWKRSISVGSQQRRNAIAHPFRSEDQITRQNRAREIK